MNDFKHEKNQDKLKYNNNAEPKFVQISPESILSIADSIGYSNIPDIVLTSLAEDTSYRLRELIQNCSQILHHSKRQKLTCDDVNTALRWSDVPLLPGQQSKAVEYEYLPEFDIYAPVEKTIDLTQEYSFYSEIEAYSPLTIHLQYLPPDSEEKAKQDIYGKYFEKITQTLLSTTDANVQVALNNIQQNGRLQPLLPSFYNLLQNLSNLCQENGYIARRIPAIFHALLTNPNLNVEPQVANFVKLLQNLLLNSGESSLSENHYSLAYNFSHILFKIATDHITHDASTPFVNALNDPSRSLIIQCKALIVLRCLQKEYLDLTTNNQWNHLIIKYHQLEDNGENVIFIRDVLQSAIVDVLRYRIYRLENGLVNFNCEKIWNESCELYRVSGDFLGDSVLRIGTFPSSICSKILHARAENHPKPCNELYWTVKCRYKPTKNAKWRFSKENSSFHPSNPIPLSNVFDIPTSSTRTAKIVFHVRNWRQRPFHQLKKKVFGKPNPTSSLFSQLAHLKFDPLSKIHFGKTSLQRNPAEFIL